MAEASDDDDAPMPDAPPVCTPDVELGAVRRTAPRVRRWTTLSLSKRMSHMSVVMCVLPGFPDTCPLSCASCPGSQTVTKNSFFGRGRGDGLKRCRRKVISAQCFTQCLVATRDVVSSLHLLRRADQGVSNVCKFLCECLDTCTAGNRP